MAIVGSLTPERAVELLRKAAQALETDGDILAELRHLVAASQMDARYWKATFDAASADGTRLAEKCDRLAGRVGALRNRLELILDYHDMTTEEFRQRYGPRLCLEEILPQLRAALRATEMEAE